MEKPSHSDEFVPADRKSPIFLVGFMAVGKSTIGRKLASALRYRFIDLDRVIESEQEKKIAEIFEEVGESEFRKIEAATLRRVSSSHHVVISLGGGAPCFHNNLAYIRSKGLVVNLHLPFETIWNRGSANASKRPLWQEGRERVEKLFLARQQYYLGATTTIDASGGAPLVVEKILANHRRFCEEPVWTEGCNWVGLDRGGYPILFSQDFAKVKDLVKAEGTFVITEETVYQHYKDELFSLCARPPIIVVPGESSKSVASWENVATSLIESGASRTSTVVGIGGGVVGDLSGFVAASLFRGVEHIQIPTTLLSMVDSSIGGKTGVNTEHGKNQLGAIWQPSKVLVCSGFLLSLPERELRSGWGEVLKYGLLIGPHIFDRLRSLTKNVFKGSWDDETTRELGWVMHTCIAYKAAIVALDERENGLRAWLNLGHTLGHAIEKTSQFSVSHGQAVALGLLAMCKVSRHSGVTTSDMTLPIERVLEAAGMDTELDPWLRQDVFDVMKFDKKRGKDSIRFVALESLGGPKIVPLGFDELCTLLSK